MFLIKIGDTSILKHLLRGSTCEIARWYTQLMFERPRFDIGYLALPTSSFI